MPYSWWAILSWPISYLIYWAANDSYRRSLKLMKFWEKQEMDRNNELIEDREQKYGKTGWACYCVALFFSEASVGWNMSDTFGPLFSVCFCILIAFMVGAIAKALVRNSGEKNLDDPEILNSGKESLNYRERRMSYRASPPLREDGSRGDAKVRRPEYTDMADPGAMGMPNGGRK